MFASLVSSNRLLERAAAQPSQKTSDGTPQGESLGVLQSLPDEILLRIFDKLDASSLARTASTAKKHLRIALDPNLGLRKETLRYALGRGAAEPAPSSIDEIGASLQYHLQTVGVARGVANLADIASDALMHLEHIKWDTPLSTEHDFYLKLFAPAMRRVVCSVSAAACIANSFTAEFADDADENGPNRWLLFFAGSQQDKQTMLLEKKFFDLPVVTLEARLGTAFSWAEPATLRAALPAYLALVKRIDTAWLALENSTLSAQFPTVYGLSNVNKRDRLEDIDKQGIFSELSERPAECIYFPQFDDVEFSMDHEMEPLCPEEVKQTILYFVLKIMSREDAKLYAGQGQDPTAYAFVSSLLAGMAEADTNFLPFRKWLLRQHYTLSSGVGPINILVRA